MRKPLLMWWSSVDILFRELVGMAKTLVEPLAELAKFLNFLADVAKFLKNCLVDLQKQ